jgi:hypothetical protein
MNKSTDTIWYDQAVYDAITTLSNKHDNTIPVFGCALSASKYLDNDFHKFVGFIPQVISSAKFYKWHGGVVDAIRTFCHLCFVDPAIVECYLGISFAELVMEVSL